MLMLARDDEQHAIPEALRARFRAVVAAFAEGDFQLSKHELDGIGPVSSETAEFVAGQIATYGANLTPLDEQVWQQSIYRWMDGHWEFLIDLSTDREPVSDLVLHATLPDSGSRRLEICSVHVP